MPLDNKTISEAIKQAKAKSGEKKFNQTVDLILDIVGNVTKLGTIYNASEVNSVVLNDQLKEVCAPLGITVLERTVSTSADVHTAAQSLVGQVDAIWIGTDNTVVSGLEALIKVCEDNKIPFFPSDDPSIKKGGIACLGFNYYDVGYQTGEMAVKILKGTPASEIPVNIKTAGLDFDALKLLIELIT
jgi:putative ABC transport system substrate-binding protein